MPEKKINLELVSSYTLEYDSEPTVVKEYDTVREFETKRRDWGVSIGYSWWDNADLFPYFDNLKSPKKEITFEVYALNDKGVRNGKAQCVIWNEFEGDVEPYVKWDAAYKDGKLNGAYITYDVQRVHKMSGKTFYVNGKAVDANTVAEWRKIQSAINTRVKSKQGKKR